ncbi:MAG: hypothetical protein Q9209_006330 [Squamulea sp. 1 TL-2023]
MKTKKIVKSVNEVSQEAYAEMLMQILFDKLEGHIKMSGPSQMDTSARGKFRKGLAGFANGIDISALADTGSRKNVISASCAQRLGIVVKGTPSSFELGNSRTTHSVGVVSLQWAFAENHKKKLPIICHVLPNCIYDLILGNEFLTATETLSKYRHRITDCFFRTLNSFAHFHFLGETCQKLQGTLADKHHVLAVPDTGAERNIINLDFAMKLGLQINKTERCHEFVQFADGTFEETLGRVHTHWTFANGQRTPIAFEVLRKCCASVIIGEEVLSDYNVFEEHASSVTTLPYKTAVYELAPFDFVHTWQKPFERLRQILRFKPQRQKTENRNEPDEAKEQRRVDAWNYEFDFGATADATEKELERLRRERHASSLANSPEATALRQRPIPGVTASGHHMPLIPSVPTART